jgi:hypothetical protein
MPKAELVLQSACRVFNDRDLEAAVELSSTYRVIKSHDADYAAGGWSAAPSRSREGYRFAT